MFSVKNVTMKRILCIFSNSFKEIKRSLKILIKIWIIFSLCTHLYLKIAALRNLKLNNSMKFNEYTYIFSKIVKIFLLLISICINTCSVNYLSVSLKTKSKYNNAFSNFPKANVHNRQHVFVIQFSSGLWILGEPT